MKSMAQLHRGDSTFHELEGSELAVVQLLFREHLRDPLLHAVLEGRRQGRAFVDHPTNPRAAIVSTGSECAYLAVDRDDAQVSAAIRRLIVEEIIPDTKAIGRDFLSLFPFPNSYAGVLEAQLADLLPLKTAVSTFSFSRKAYLARRAKAHPLPAGFRLALIDEEILAKPDNARLAEEIEIYWGSTGDLAPERGHCVFEGDVIASWCYVQAIGAESETNDIWTAPEHRRKGLGTAVASAFIDNCLAEGHTPFWLCDQANVPSRRLAERVGFEHRGDIFLVDIPFHPFEFYRGLALHFFMPNQAYGQAAEAFERAFSVQEGAADDYYQAAISWASIGNVERAWADLHRAVERGWRDVKRAQDDEALAPLRDTDEWQTWINQV